MRSTPAVPYPRLSASEPLFTLEENAVNNGHGRRARRSVSVSRKGAKAAKALPRIDDMGEVSASVYRAKNAKAPPRVFDMAEVSAEFCFHKVSSLLS